LQSKNIGTFWVTTICCVVSVLALMEVPAECDAMSIAPSRIVLNAECVGSSQDIQAIFPFVWPADCEFEKFEGEFYFEGEDGPVCTTDSFHYCYLDDILLVSFDRGEIQAYAKEHELPDGVYEVTVSCTLKVKCDDDGSVTSIPLEGTDLVEIRTPGNKKE